jgi:hypothetical protein
MEVLLSDLNEVIGVLTDIFEEIALSNIYLRAFHERQLDTERKEKAVEEAFMNLKQGVNAIPKA